MSRLSLCFVLVVLYEALGAPSVRQEYNYFLSFAQRQSNVLSSGQIQHGGEVTPVGVMGDDSIDNIVGGDEVDIKQYPYQVSLLFMGNFGCGGSIISEEYILTAAHCIHKIPSNMLSVRVGSNLTEEGGKIYQIKKYTVHEKYSSDPYNFNYDVGVLKTSEKISINGETTAIVKLPEAGSTMKPGDNIVVSGWGTTSEGGIPSHVLRAVSVPVVSLEQCTEAYKNTKLVISENMVCAGVPEGGKDACQGDSGGPAIAEDSRLQHGIVSFGRGCAQKEYPGVYTSVAALRDWIKGVSGV